MNCKTLVFIGILSFLSHLSYFSCAQTKKEISKDFFNSWFVYQSVSIPENIELNDFTNENFHLLISVINEHVVDTLFESKWLGVTLTNRIGTISQDEQLKKISISLLLRFLFDSDTRILHAAAEGIQQYPNIYFTAQHKDTLVLVTRTTINRNVATSLYRLCGKLEIKAVIPTLEENANNTNNPFIQRWVALAALTRMGDKNAEEKMLDFIKKTGFSLDAINMLYPYITYSRSRTNVNYLISAIKNDNSNCESSNPNVTTRIPCSYHILKVVGPEIVGLNWNGPNGLEMLKPDDALAKALVFFKKVENNWEFVGD